MLTLLAVYAQEEARSVSENQKWRIKSNYEQGLPWSITMYGYKLVNGVLEIVPEEAEIPALPQICTLKERGIKLSRALSCAGARGKREAKCARMLSGPAFQ